MTDGNLKIGFLRPGAGNTHYDEFAAMVPEGIDLEMVELGGPPHRAHRLRRTRRRHHRAGHHDDA